MSTMSEIMIGAKKPKEKLVRLGKHTDGWANSSFY